MKNRIAKKCTLLLVAVLVSLNAFSQTAADYLSNGNNLAKEGNYSNALTAFSSAIKLDSTNAEAYYLRGKCYFMMENDALAIKDYDRSLRIDPYKKDAYYMRAQSKGFMGDLNGASADYYSAIVIDSNYVDAYIKRAYIFIQQKEYMQGFVYFSIAIKKQAEPGADLYFGRGYCQQMFGALDGAITDYKVAAELNPNIGDVYLNMGNTYLQKRDDDNALLCYDKADKQKPNDYRVIIGRAYAYFSKGDYKTACENRKKAIELGYVDSTNKFTEHCK